MTITRGNTIKLQPGMNSFMFGALSVTCECDKDGNTMWWKEINGKCEDYKSYDNLGHVINHKHTDTGFLGSTYEEWWMYDNTILLQYKKVEGKEIEIKKYDRNGRIFYYLDIDSLGKDEQWTEYDDHGDIKYFKEELNGVIQREKIFNDGRLTSLRKLNKTTFYEYDDQGREVYRYTRNEKDIIIDKTWTEYDKEGKPNSHKSTPDSRTRKVSNKISELVNEFDEETAKMSEKDDKKEHKKMPWWGYLILIFIFFLNPFMFTLVGVTLFKLAIKYGIPAFFIYYFGRVIIRMIKKRM